MALENSYAEPVSRLLTIGDPDDLSDPNDWQHSSGWPEYVNRFGLTSADIPELIRMATDVALNETEEDSEELWAPLHAWRALGQLQAEEAVGPLIGLFHYADNEDFEWYSEELPEVLGMIGPAAIRPTAKYLANPKHGLWARVVAVTSLQGIATAHPGTRQECITALMDVLNKYAENDAILNGEIVASLAELDAVEAAPLVEQVYKADQVDETVIGDWEDFQVNVGLLEKRITDPDTDLDLNPFFPAGFGESQRRPKKEAKQVKKKRKQEKESRKKNRKKKK